MSCPTCHMPEWIPVLQRLPHDREEVLFAVGSAVYYGALHIKICPCGGVNCQAEHEPIQWREVGDDCATLGVTHWMPTPEGPHETR